MSSTFYYQRVIRSNSNKAEETIRNKIEKIGIKRNFILSLG